MVQLTKLRWLEMSTALLLRNTLKVVLEGAANRVIWQFQHQEGGKSRVVFLFFR